MNAISDTLATRLAAIVGRSAVITERDALTPYETEWRGRYHGARGWWCARPRPRRWPR